MLLLANTANADTYFETSPNTIYWEGLSYEFTNATAYQVTQPIIDNYEFGIVAITSQLYWTCDGCYKIIPQNYAARFSKSFYIHNWEIGAGVNYWTNTSIIFPEKHSFEFTIGYKFSEKTNITVKHYNDLNQSYPNFGLSRISIEHKF